MALDAPANVVELCKLVASNHPWLAALRMRATGVTAIMHNESAYVDGKLLRFALPPPHQRVTEWLASSLRQNTSLRELDLHGCHLSDDACASLARALMDVPLLALDVSNNRAGRACADALAALLTTSNSLEVLNVNQNLLGDAGAGALAEGVAKSALTSLSCGNNRFADNGVMFLTFACAQSKKLSALELSGSDLGGGIGAVDRFVNVIGASAITTLHAGECALGTEGGERMATILETSRVLSTLHLWGNEMGDAACVAMAHALASNSKITYLSLRRNAFGDDGAVAMAQALSTNRSVLTLDLAGNRIAERGVRSLCEVLREQERLTELDLSGNAFGGTADGEASSSVVSLLRHNKTLTSLNLSENAIKPSACLQISAATQANTSIGAVYLSAASLGAEGIEMLTSDPASHFWESRVHIVAS